MGRSRRSNGGREPNLGLPSNPGRHVESGIQDSAEHHRGDSGTAWYRTGSGAKPKNDWERVSEATLGTDRSSGFFPDRGVDSERPETISGFVLPGSVHPESGDRGHRIQGEWTLDGSDRQ